MRSFEEITFGSPKVMTDHSEAQVQGSRPAKLRGNHLRVAEGDDCPLEGTSPRIKTCEASRRSPSVTRRWRLTTRKHKLEYENLPRFSTPKDIKCRVQPGRRSAEPSSGIGVRVKREYVRRSDFYTSHLVILS